MPRLCFSIRTGKRKAAFMRANGGPEKAEGMRHSRMPWSGAGHLRAVIGNEYAVESVLVENGDHSKHIDVAVIDKCLVVMRHFAAYIAEVNVRDSLLHTVVVKRFVKIAASHLSQRSKATLEHVARAGRNIDQALIHLGLIDQSRLLAEGWRWWIVRMRGHANACLFCNRQHIFKEPLKPAPK